MGEGWEREGEANGKGAGVCFSHSLTRDTEPVGDIHEKVCCKELIYEIWRSDWASLRSGGRPWGKVGFLGRAEAAVCSRVSSSAGQPRLFSCTFPFN